MIKVTIYSSQHRIDFGPKVMKNSDRYTVLTLNKRTPNQANRSLLDPKSIIEITISIENRLKVAFQTLLYEMTITVIWDYTSLPADFV